MPRRKDSAGGLCPTRPWRPGLATVDRLRRRRLGVAGAEFCRKALVELDSGALASAATVRPAWARRRKCDGAAFYLCRRDRSLPLLRASAAMTSPRVARVGPLRTFDRGRAAVPGAALRHGYGVSEADRRAPRRQYSRLRRGAHACGLVQGIERRPRGRKLRRTAPLFSQLYAHDCTGGSGIRRRWRIERLCADEMALSRLGTSVRSIVAGLLPCLSGDPDSDGAGAGRARSLRLARGARARPRRLWDSRDDTPSSATSISAVTTRFSTPHASTAPDSFGPSPRSLAALGARDGGRGDSPVHWHLERLPIRSHVLGARQPRRSLSRSTISPERASAPASTMSTWRQRY